MELSSLKTSGTALTFAYFIAGADTEARNWPAMHMPLVVDLNLRPFPGCRFAGVDYNGIRRALWKSGPDFEHIIHTTPMTLRFLSLSQSGADEL